MNFPYNWKKNPHTHGISGLLNSLTYPLYHLNPPTNPRIIINGTFTCRWRSRPWNSSSLLCVWRTKFTLGVNIEVLWEESNIYSTLVMSLRTSCPKFITRSLVAGHGSISKALSYVNVIFLNFLQNSGCCVILSSLSQVKGESCASFLGGGAGAGSVMDFVIALVWAEVGRCFSTLNFLRQVLKLQTLCSEGVKFFKLASYIVCWSRYLTKQHWLSFSFYDRRKCCVDALSNSTILTHAGSCLLFTTLFTSFLRFFTSFFIYFFFVSSWLYS